MATKNSTILDQIWLAGTDDYQQRVPRASQRGVAGVAETLFAPMNRSYYNQFVNTLVQRIGLTVVRELAWDNPLAQFKRENLLFGQTIQEVANKLIRAHGYDIEDGNLFEINRPESEVAYHSLNRKDRYDISVNEDELRGAFTTPDGLSKYVASIMAIPQTSDQYDEYQIMKKLFSEYDARDGGFYKQHVDAVADEATAKTLLANIRAYTGKMGFLSSLYDKAGVPVFAEPKNMVLFTTPEISANIDVHALAGAFNVSLADVQTRVVLLDEFPMPNVQAILASRDIFMSADYLYQVDNFYNQKTLTNNYYLHHWGVYSMSPFMPAVEFTTGESTKPETITMTLTGLNLATANSEGKTVTKGKVYDGETYHLVPTTTGTVDPANGNVAVKPDSMTYEITATDDKGTAVALNSRTYIDQSGNLKVQKNLKANTKLAIKGTTTYINPSTGKKSDLTATTEFTVLD